MARKKKTQAPPPEPVVEVLEAPAVEPVPEPAPEVVLEREPAPAGYVYPEGAEGEVTTIRDYGSFRIVRDSRGRMIRQFKG